MILTRINASRFSRLLAFLPAIALSTAQLARGDDPSTGELQPASAELRLLPAPTIESLPSQTFDEELVSLLLQPGEGPKIQTAPPSPTTAPAAPVTPSAAPAPPMKVPMPATVPSPATVPMPVPTPPVIEVLPSQTAPIETPLAQPGYDRRPIGSLGVDIRPPEGDVPPDVARETFASTDALPYAARPHSETMFFWTAPNLCHRPLYYEQRYVERYGYSAGCLQPVLSGAQFFGTVPLVPFKMIVAPPRRCIYTLGQGRPDGLRK